jgi:hypothetical protein
MTTDASALTIHAQCPGRANFIQPDGTIFTSRHYQVYTSSDDGRTWAFATEMPAPWFRRFAQLSRMTCRLFRHEAKALATLSDGTIIAGNRDWVFRAALGEPRMSPAKIEDGDVPATPPMSFTVEADDRILWGEYGGNQFQRPPAPRIFVSENAGRTYTPVHTFRRGEIRHIHNIVSDRDRGGYWVFVGDHNHEPGIGWLSADLKHYEWVQKGKQSYRAVCAFDFGDHLIYGTDTEMESNALMRLDKATGRVDRMRELGGSVIYACKFGRIYTLTTTVEPSKVNPLREAVLWASEDGHNWREVFRAPKDRWGERVFQFGSIVLPRGQSNRETIVFSGQAVAGIDGKVTVATLAGEHG